MCPRRCLLGPPPRTPLVAKAVGLGSMRHSFLAACAC